MEPLGEKKFTERKWQPRRSGQRKETNSECLPLARSLDRASSDWSALVLMGGNNSTLDQTDFDGRPLVGLGLN